MGVTESLGLPRVDQLRAVRERLAEAIDSTLTDSRALAGLAKAFAEVSSLIDDLAGPEEESPLDRIRAAESARTASVSQLPTGSQQRGRGRSRASS